jgi:pro-apoptotic serine protease NMA111
MSRVVIFCEAVLQQPNPTIFEKVSKLPSKVYVSSRKPESPAQMHDLKPTRFITHINGVATQDLDSFISEIRKTVSDTNYRLNIATLNGHPSIVYIKQNVHYVSFGHNFITDD